MKNWMKYVLVGAVFMVAGALLPRAQQVVTLPTLPNVSLGTSIPKPDSPSTGRYQLHQGIFQVDAAGEIIRNEGVFKIDTTTGRTWMFTIKVGPDGNRAEGWVRLKDGSSAE